MSSANEPDGAPLAASDLPPLGAMPTRMGLTLWFGRVQRELDQLESDISSKEGFFVFKTHTYSKTELRQHPSFRLVEVLVDQIGNHVSMWEAEGKLTGPERSAYIKSRADVERQTSELRRQIAARRDTVFEGITTFLRYIMDKLPNLLETLLVEGGRMLLGLPPSPRSSQGRIRQKLDSEWED